jgi:hypothetical protein
MYQPQPRTIPYRAIEFLKTHPAGSELAAAVICEALGTDTNGFATCMTPAKRAGLVQARKEGRLLMWSLGDGTPEDLPEDYQPDEPLKRAEQSSPPVAEFNAALWADGDLVLYGAQLNEDNSVTLNAKQTRTLCQLLAGQGT